MRVLISQDPYARAESGPAWDGNGVWPARWVACPSSGPPPFVSAYRRRFAVDVARTVRIHVTADERYELFLDGTRIGRGPERGDGRHWFFETYGLPLAAGEHILVARVWALGSRAPFAQMSVRPGFLLSPQSREDLDLLATGVAAWDAKRLGGYEFKDPSAAWGTGANVVVHGADFAWGFARGEGDGWQPVVVGEAGADAVRSNDYPPTHLLTPATLPPMLDDPRQVGTVRLVAEAASSETHGVPVRAADNLPDEQRAWQQMLRGGGSVTVPANARRRVLIDLENYYCAYPELVTSGGAGGSVRAHWQECLFNEPDAKTKGNRDEVEGKYFVTIWHLTDGIGDTFRPDGGEARRFETLWWQCGRYVEVLVDTGGSPLTVERLAFRETRYPLEPESEFAASDPRLADVTPLMTRALQMCSHETYMDCPYYEQLMYVGDTRLEVLTTYALTRDDHLPRKALAMFDASRLTTNLTQSRYPSRVTQIIPPFSLWWVAMLSDYALWRDDLALVRHLLPGARGVLDYFLAQRNLDGLLQAPPGWNYMDWVPTWPSGMPPNGGADGVSGPLNWQFLLVLTLMARLEEGLGEPEMAARARRIAGEMAARMTDAFWDEGRGLFADDLPRENFSEHSQCLALLSGLVAPDQRARVAEGLLSAPDLARTTIYFAHYLFETYYQLGRTDALLDRMGLWFELKSNGLKTTIEMPEPTRSDCHAWGAHPLYHYYASLLGIRPGGLGFRTVAIAPQLGPLTHARGSLVHPRGTIDVDLRAAGGVVTGRVTLPEGVAGTFTLGGHTMPLVAGRQEVGLP